MVTERIGFLTATLGDSSIALRTDDGGERWERLLIDRSFRLGEFAFHSVDTGYLMAWAGVGMEVLRTTDGGNTWHKQTVGLDTVFRRSLRVHPNGTLYALTGSYNRDPGLARSQDGGASWSTIYTPPSPCLDGLHVVGDRLYFTTGGAVVVTDVDGAVVKSTGIATSYALDVADADPYLVTEQRRVLQTSDGGTSWATLTDDEAKVIVYDTADGVVVLRAREYCGDSSDEPSAFDSGQVGDEALRAGGVMLTWEPWSVTHTARAGQGRYLLFRGAEVWVLERG